MTKCSRSWKDGSLGFPIEYKCNCEAVENEFGLTYCPKHLKQWKQNQNAYRPITEQEFKDGKTMKFLNGTVKQFKHINGIIYKYDGVKGNWSIPTKINPDYRLFKIKK